MYHKFFSIFSLDPMQPPTNLGSWMATKKWSFPEPGVSCRKGEALREACRSCRSNCGLQKPVDGDIAGVIKVIHVEDDLTF